MIDNNAAYKYETTYEGPFMINQYCTNGMVKLQYGGVKIRYTICCIKPYIYDKNIEDIQCLKLMVDKLTLGKYQLYTSVLY